MYDGNKSPETGVPICLDCFRTVKEIEDADIARQAQLVNEARARLHRTIGLDVPASAPMLRLQPRPARIVVNQVHIGGDNLGNVNVGSLAAVRQSIRVVRESGNAALADSVERLTAAVESSRELESAERALAIQLLGVIAAELGAQRRGLGMLAVVANLSAIVSAASDVAPLLKEALPAMLAALAPGG
jgi:hypothetical protein